MTCMEKELAFHDLVFAPKIRNYSQLDVAELIHRPLHRFNILVRSKFESLMHYTPQMVLLPYLPRVSHPLWAVENLKNSK